MKPLERELDKLIQLWAVNHCSQISKQKAQCGHHIIPRANKLFRWDIRNIVPLTYQEHFKIHSADTKDKNDYRTKEQKQFEEQNRNKSLKEYILRNGITFGEFLKIKHKELKNLLKLIK